MGGRTLYRWAKDVTSPKVSKLVWETLKGMLEFAHSSRIEPC